MAKILFKDLDSLDFTPVPGDRIYLSWDLGSGKTTLVRSILSRILWPETLVKSPTYTYYRSYDKNIFHFDLYRVEDYDTFVAIWWEEILENPATLCFVEWSESIRGRYAPTVEITCKKLPDEPEARDIEIVRINYPISIGSVL